MMENLMENVCILNIEVCFRAFGLHASFGRIKTHEQLRGLLFDRTHPTPMANIWLDVPSFTLGPVLEKSHIGVLIQSFCPRPYPPRRLKGKRGLRMGQRPCVPLCALEFMNWNSRQIEGGGGLICPLSHSKEAKDADRGHDILSQLSKKSLKGENGWRRVCVLCSGTVTWSVRDSGHFPKTQIGKFVDGLATLLQCT